MNKNLTILVSAAGSSTMPGQIKCFKNNGERNIRIVGVDMSDDPTCKDVVDVFYQVPSSTDNKYCDIILDICKKENVNIYFPNISVEVEKVSERLLDFENIGVYVAISDEQSIKICNNKLEVYHELEKNGVPIPKYFAVNNLQDFEKGCQYMGYPQKPICVKIVNSSGSRGVRIIDATKDRYHIYAFEKPNSFFTSYDDMFSILKSANEILPMMLVEYMQGNEYTVDLLADKGTVLYIAGRENIVSMMSIAQQSIVKHDGFAYDICGKIVKLLNYTGNIGFDFMRDQNGTPYLMDINPRLTATVSLIAAAGINLPYLRIKQILGEPMPMCNLIEGTRLTRRYSEYFCDPNGVKLQF